MNPYRYLQAKMARFVFEFSNIHEKSQYEVPVSYESPENYSDTALNREEGEADTGSEKDSFYIFNLGVDIKEGQEKPAAFYIRLSGYLISIILPFIGSSKKQKIDESALVETLFNSIIENSIDPAKIIIKGVDPKQIDSVRNQLNARLQAMDKTPIPSEHRLNARIPSEHRLNARIPSEHRLFSFEMVKVQDFIKKPENIGVELDTIFIQPENPNGKYIINCAARGRTYLDWVADMKKDSDLTSATVVGFNYRGIGNSRGTMITQQNVVDDIVAEVKYLMQEKHADPKNICLYGLCLGGGFAALAAAELAKENIEVKLYMSRSFKQFDKTIIDLVMPRKYDKWPNYLLKILFFPILIPLTIGFKIYSKILGWGVNVGSALKQLKAENIEYDFAEPSKSDKENGFIGDKIVLTDNSPYAVIQHKLHARAKEEAKRLQEFEPDAILRAQIAKGAAIANLGEEDALWLEEESLAFLLDIETIISNIKTKINDSLPTSEIKQLQQELQQLEALRQGLCLARVSTLLAHQVRRIDPREKAWDPHACSSDKIAAYGFSGTQRQRFAWFVNESPLGFIPEKSVDYTEQPAHCCAF